MQSFFISLKRICKALRNPPKLNKIDLTLYFEWQYVIIATHVEIFRHCEIFAINDMLYQLTF